MITDRDLFCIDDLDPAMREVTGRVVFIQAQARRVTTPRGRLLEDEGYGYDIREELSSEVTRVTLTKSAQNVRGELSKDERVLRVNASTTVSGDVKTPTLKIAIDGEATDGPFEFTMTVDKVKSALLFGNG